MSAKGDNERSFQVAAYALLQEKVIGLISLEQHRERYRELRELYFGEEKKDE